MYYLIAFAIMPGSRRDVQHKLFWIPAFAGMSGEEGYARQASQCRCPSLAADLVAGDFVKRSLKLAGVGFFRLGEGFKP